MEDSQGYELFGEITLKIQRFVVVVGMFIVICRCGYRCVYWHVQVCTLMYIVMVIVVFIVYTGVVIGVFVVVEYMCDCKCFNQ